MENTSLRDAVKKAALAHCDAAAICGVHANACYHARYLNATDFGLPDGLSYLTRNPDGRFDIDSRYPGAKSLLVCLFSYWDENTDENLLSLTPDEWLASRRARGLKAPPDWLYALAREEGMARVARYAAGQDYHVAVKGALGRIFKSIQAFAPDVEGRSFVDTSPISEKSFAVQCGLGWMGKNTLLINKERGSYFVIGLLALSLPLEPDTALYPDECGECHRCIDACPCGALSPYRLNQSLCLAYWTTQHKGGAPEPEILRALNDRLEGCDLCQQACPYNSGNKAKRNKIF